MKRRAVFSWIAVFVFLTCLPLSACKKEQKTGCRYEIKAEYVPENATLCAAQKVTYENRTETCLETLKFNLYPNAYRENSSVSPLPSAERDAAFYQGESYGEIQITSVVGGKGWEIAGQDQNLLCVDLTEPLYPNETVTIDIGFVTTLAKVNHRTGVGERTINLGNFYPVLCAYKNGFCECLYYGEGDPFFSECADYELTLTIPKGMTAATSGSLTDESTLESKKVCRYEASSVRDFAVVLSSEFETVERTVGATTLQYVSLRGEDETERSRAVTVMESAFSYFCKTFGEYPYSTFTIVRTSMFSVGAEYPALAMISSSVVGLDAVRAIVHETAHQWWFAVVGSDQTTNAWQDEGLAEYSTVLYFENHSEHGLTRQGLVAESLAEYRAYFSAYSVLGEEIDTSMQRPISEYASGYEYKTIAYDKSVVLMDAIRTGVGEKRFFSSLKRYYADQKFRLATPEDFIGSFEKTGVDISGLVRGFLSGEAIL